MAKRQEYSWRNSPNYKQFDARIDIRLSDRHHRMIYKFNRFNKGRFIRELIRTDMRDGYLVFEVSDYEKIHKSFKPSDIEDILANNFVRHKTHKITVRLYSTEKEYVQMRSGGNISKYIDFLLNEFVKDILGWYDNREEI